MANVSVYLNFFNRPDTFQYVFNAVRAAKPSRLFLSCDGPRDNNSDDIVKIKECQTIAENIDWDCEVYRNYAEKNLGCGMRMFSGISWAFEYVDRLIILEDDCVPSLDYFRFCEELLERYKNDSRIFQINAMNHLGKYEETNNSYFFGLGCCWGWATWKRVWEKMDFYMNFLEDEYSVKCAERRYLFYNNALEEGKIKKGILEKTGRLSSWTYQFGLAAVLQSQIAIVPSVNLVTNIGYTPGSTHAAGSIKKMPRKTQAYFNASVYKMSFPLIHPKFIVEDFNYIDEVRRKYKYNIVDYIELIVRSVLYSKPQELMRKVKKTSINK